MQTTTVAKAKLISVTEENEEEVAQEEATALAKTQAELTKLEKNIEVAKKSVVNNEWEVASNLKQIHDRDLWRAAGKYKSFAVYSSERFQFSKDKVAAYLAVAETFKDRDQIKGFSITQLWLLSRVDTDQDRLVLISKIKNNEVTNTRELADAVKVKRIEAGLDTKKREGKERPLLVHEKRKAGVIAEGVFKLNAKGDSFYFSFEFGEQKFRVTRSFTTHAVKVELLPA